MRGHVRIFKAVFCFMACSAVVFAQKSTGNIVGQVVDGEGHPVSGVTLTLTGVYTAPLQAQTDAQGRFRFLSLYPDRGYEIKAERKEHQTQVLTGVPAEIGLDTEVLLTMAGGRPDEVVASVFIPPSVRKAGSTFTTIFDKAYLAGLPSTRDPWSFLQQAPAVFLDRENIGGVESGLQPALMVRGLTTREWNVNGIKVTDMLSGGSPGYYDFDAIQQISVTTGIPDIEQKNPAVTINIVTGRGGNDLSLGARLFASGQKLQASVSSETLSQFGLASADRINSIFDYGINVGGPLLKNKIWGWAAFGKQDLERATPTVLEYNTYLTNAEAKLNFQLLPGNRGEIYFSRAIKTSTGRSSTPSFPSGYDQRDIGNPTFIIQDEQMIGDRAALSARFGFSNGGFALYPGNDPDVNGVYWYDVENGAILNTNKWFNSSRPHSYGVLQLQAFGGDLFGTGLSHELKIGLEVNNSSRTYIGGYPGNFAVKTNYNTPTVDWDGDGAADVVKNMPDAPLFSLISLYSGDTNFRDGAKRLAFYAADSLAVKRLNVTFGLRVDWMKSYVEAQTTRALWRPGDANPAGDESLANYASIAASFFPAETLSALFPLIPERDVPYYETEKTYWLFSPRLGLTYDLFGDGRTILRAGYALYRGAPLGVSPWTPMYRYGYSSFWWADADGDAHPQPAELYFPYYSILYRAFDDEGRYLGTYGSGRLFGPANHVDTKTWSPPITHELNFSIEREIIRDFGLSLGFVWRRMGNFSWNLPYYPSDMYPKLNDHVRGPDDYLQVTTIPDVIVDPATGIGYSTGEAAGRPFYALRNVPETAATSYTMTTMQDSERRDVYWGIDIAVSKRLTNKWMFSGSFTYQSQRSYYGADGEGYVGPQGPYDPTNLWAYEGQLTTYNLGATSGKASVPMFSRWLLKASALYQLPWNINLSAALSAHEGSLYGDVFILAYSSIPGQASKNISITRVGNDNRGRLGDVWNLSLKVEKAVRIGETGRLYISADVFNALNAAPVLRRNDLNMGTFEMSGSTPSSWTAPPATQGAYLEIMSPLVVRFGLRVQI